MSNLFTWIAQATISFHGLKPSHWPNFWFALVADLTGMRYSTCMVLCPVSPPEGCDLTGLWIINLQASLKRMKLIYENTSAFVFFNSATYVLPPQATAWWPSSDGRCCILVPSLSFAQPWQSCTGAYTRRESANFSALWACFAAASYSVALFISMKVEHALAAACNIKHLVGFILTWFFDLSQARHCLQNKRDLAPHLTWGLGAK